MFTEDFKFENFKKTRVKVYFHSQDKVEGEHRLNK